MLHVASMAIAFFICLTRLRDKGDCLSFLTLSIVIVFSKQQPPKIDEQEEIEARLTTLLLRVGDKSASSQQTPIQQISGADINVLALLFM